MNDQWNDKIFNVDGGNFESLALEIFHFQYSYNAIYKAYTDILRIDVRKIKSAFQIPFLPIQIFKTHAVKTTGFEPEMVFESSGTSQSTNSHHFIKDVELYRESFMKAFEMFYGPVNEWCIIALLPSYLERKHSSLVFMTDELIRRSRHSESGFYLDEYEKLHVTLKQLEAAKQKTLLLGVSFALIEFAERFPLALAHTIIMETGGMKGRREEMVRDKLHQLLEEKFQVEHVHSEYGMTELLSQAYSKKDGLFESPPWMKIFIRDEEDPLEVHAVERSESGVRGPVPATGSAGYGAHSQLKPFVTGAINIIDLANVYSCSFIATDDAGKLHTHDGRFEVLGRLDNSDIRGCSLMII